jgi:predicted esterase
MGGAGTYHIAAKYPDIWAGLAVAAPAANPPPDQLAKFADVPILVLQGDQDRSVPVTQTRETVARMRSAGLQHVYVELAGGDHTNFIAKNGDSLAKVFAFFNVVRKDQRAR